MRLKYILIFGLALFGFILLIVSMNIEAKTITVSRGYFEDIQAAIDDASPGDTIFVKNGTYRQEYAGQKIAAITVNKNINLTGESNQDTIIGDDYQTNNPYRGVYVIADYVNISNLKVNNFGEEGIYLSSSNSNVRSNTIINNQKGILSYGSNNTITSNTFMNNEYNIYLSGSNNTITSNIMTGGDGIYYEFSSNNIISSNTITNCNSGILFYYGSDSNIISSNTITNCGFGIHFTRGGGYNIIISNTITNISSWWDISFLSDSRNNTIIGCTNISRVMMYYTYSTIVKNYLDIVIQYPNQTLIQSAFVEIEDNNNTIFTGQTNINGMIERVLVTDGIYNGNIKTENITTVIVSYRDFLFSNNTRSVNMSTSHTEFFIKLNLPDIPNITTTSQINIDSNYIINWTTSDYASGYAIYENNIEIYNGTNLTMNFTNKPNGTYIYKVRAWNANGTSANSSEVTIIISNHPPTIVPVSDQTAIMLRQFTHQVNATDEENDSLTYTTNIGNITDTGLFSYTPTVPGIYNINITIFDREFQSNISFNLTVPNLPPIANAGNNATIYNSTAILLNGTAYDPDGYIIKYEWDFNGDGTFEWKSTNNGMFTYSYAIPGEYNATFRATDNFDGTNTSMIKITVLDILSLLNQTIPQNNTTNQTQTSPRNHAPTMTNITANRTTINASEQITITINATDQDNDTLNYSYSATDGTITGNSSIAIWTSPSTNGTYTITVVVSDGNLTVTETVNITVVNVTSPLITNTPPTATITSIAPNPAIHNQSIITFAGSGADSDGTIVEYLWESSISGVIGTSATFTNNSLPVGNHTITFKVKDNNNTWSEPVSATLTINTSGGNATITEKPPESKKGFISGFESIFVTLAIGILILISIRRRK